MHLEGDDEFVDSCFDGSSIEDVGGHGLGVLILPIKGDDLCRRMWLEGVQPVEELHKHFQGPLLQHLLQCLTHIRAIPDHDGLVKKEHRSVFEHLRDHILGATTSEGTQKLGVYQGNVPDESFGEEGG